MVTTPPYSLVLTHDIDHMSLAELPRCGRTFIGFFYRCFAENMYRAVRRKISIGDYIRSLEACVRAISAMIGMGRDMWAQSLGDMITLEDRLGVRSTLFFITMPGKAGVMPGSLRPAPANRAAFYRLADYLPVLRDLVQGGWEIGVHGINAWRSEADARLELNALRAVVPDQQCVGIRMHWLYSVPGMWSHLESAGFAYDATLGWNDRVGFPENRYHPFRPNGSQRFSVLPLNVQDGALVRDGYTGLTLEGAWQEMLGLLSAARTKRAVLTVLWHNTSFAPPRLWSEFYERLIKQAQDDGAEILTAAQAVSTRYGGE